MRPIERALEEIRALHERVTRSPAPDVTPQMFQPFPPGADPVAHAILEVAQLKQAVEQTDRRAEAGPPTHWVPRASVFVGDDGFRVVLEIAGVSRDEASLCVAGGELIVRGERKPPQVRDGLKPIIVEQSCGRFERRFPLPAWCTPQAISARCANGVLEIDIERSGKEDATQVRIEIG